MAMLPVPGVDRNIQGKWVALTPERQLVCDLLRHAKKIPSIPSQRRMRLGEVIAARNSQLSAISWCAIFLKAYAIVSARHPELRRTYLPLPWPHLYEHPINVASFSIERTAGDGPAVYFSQIARPETMTLKELDAIVRSCKNEQLESLPSVSRARWIGRLPWPLRRLMWWAGLYADGACRAHFFGTFGISVTASQGAAGLHLLSPLTTTLNYGVFEPDGSLDVRIVYDHRVVDGSPIARALAELESVLRTSIRDELLEDRIHQEISIPVSRRPLVVT